LSPLKHFALTPLTEQGKKNYVMAERGDYVTHHNGGVNHNPAQNASTAFAIFFITFPVEFAHQDTSNNSITDSLQDPKLKH
jgi:hypothetical protein